MTLHMVIWLKLKTFFFMQNGLFCVYLEVIQLLLLFEYMTEMIRQVFLSYYVANMSCLEIHIFLTLL